MSEEKRLDQNSIERVLAQNQAQAADDYRLLELYIEAQQPKTFNPILLKAVYEEMKRRSLN